MTQPSYDELVRRLALVEERLAASEEARSPAGVAAALDVSHNPRGTADVPRALNANGNTIGRPTPRLRFAGGATYNPTLNLIEVAGSSGDRLYSADVSYVPAERVSWLTAAGGLVAYVVGGNGLDGGTMGRGIGMLVGDPTPPTVDDGLYSEVAAGYNATTGAGRAVMRVPNGGAGSPLGSFVRLNGTAARVEGVRPAGAGGGAQASVTLACGDASVNLTSSQPVVGNVIHSLRLGTSTAPAQPALELARETVAGGSSSVRCTLNGGTVVLLDHLSRSEWLRTAALATSPAPVRRLMAGPFVVPVVALAAGASTTVTVADARLAGSSYAAMGSMVGAAGSEWLLWSSSPSGTSALDVTVTNSHPSSALSADLTLYAISVP